MDFTASIQPGSRVEVCYKTNLKGKRLTWFPGTIDLLTTEKTQTSCEVSVTIIFDKYSGFESTKTKFHLNQNSNELLDEFNQTFPFRSISMSSIDKDTNSSMENDSMSMDMDINILPDLLKQDNLMTDSDEYTNESDMAVGKKPWRKEGKRNHKDLQRTNFDILLKSIECMEERQLILERRLGTGHVDVIRMQLSQLMDIALKKNRNVKTFSTFKKHSGCTRTMLPATISASVVCSLHDFEKFVTILQKLDLEFTCNPSISEWRSTKATEVTLNCKNIQNMGIFFGITKLDQSRLLVTKKVSRNGTISSYRLIGTFIQSSKENGPMILCIGGDCMQWVDNQMFLYRKSSKFNEIRRYNDPIQSLCQASTHKSLKDQFTLDETEKIKKEYFFGFQWKCTTSEVSSAVCTASTRRDMIFGTIKATIPIVNVCNKDYADEIQNEIISINQANKDPKAVDDSSDEEIF